MLRESRVYKYAVNDTIKINTGGSHINKYNGEYGTILRISNMYDAGGNVTPYSMCSVYLFNVSSEAERLVDVVETMLQRVHVDMQVKLANVFNIPRIVSFLVFDQSPAQELTPLTSELGQKHDQFRTDAPISKQEPTENTNEPT